MSRVRGGDCGVGRDRAPGRSPHGYAGRDPSKLRRHLLRPLVVAASDDQSHGQMAERTGSREAIEFLVCLGVLELAHPAERLVAMLPVREVLDGCRVDEHDAAHPIRVSEGVEADDDPAERVADEDWCLEVEASYDGGEILDRVEQRARNPSRVLRDDALHSGPRVGDDGRLRRRLLQHRGPARCDTRATGLEHHGWACARTANFEHLAIDPGDLTLLHLSTLAGARSGNVVKSFPRKAIDCTISRDDTSRVAVVLVTGLPGSGKSAVYRRLVERGLEAFGLEEDGFCEVFSRTTGLAVEFPTDRTDGDTEDLDVRIHRDRIESLVAGSEGRTVYLCGGAGHEFEFWELLDRVIYLSTDDATLRRRLIERTDNSYGKTPEEMAGILEANATWDGMYRDHGAVIVDSTHTLDDVVNDVIAVAEDHRP